MEYLGLVILENEVTMDPIKVARVHEWPVPRNCKEVQSFLGFVNFYHRFIRDFSGITHPLFDLTCLDIPWSWEASQQKALDDLKMAVTTAPVLTSPRESAPFRIEADSSDIASGAVLSQRSPEDSNWHPVAFLSKSLSPVERNYEVHNKELLAIVRALKE